MKRIVTLASSLLAAWPLQVMSPDHVAAAQANRAGSSAYPAVSRDYLTALEILGVRPGQTLSEARAAAASWGATLEAEGLRNNSVSLSPARPYNQAEVARAFTYRSQATSGYRGHPRLLDIASPHSPLTPGVIQVFVFPRQPLGDLSDPDNLVVYYVDTLFAFAGNPASQNTGITAAEFLRDGARRVGRQLYTGRETRREDCNFAVTDYAQRIQLLAEARQPASFPQLTAWKACGPIALAQYQVSNSTLKNYRIAHTDATLAERALEALRVFGSDLR